MSNETTLDDVLAHEEGPDPVTATAWPYGEVK